ncbi:tetratricopeptide repeat protein [Alteromonas sp. A081]|uniref:tetratricopeptide repeat protein n=1 Tax=Alteromonas sp. A081 TaxID=3410269 RepID=UPI003B982D90
MKRHRLTADSKTQGLKVYLILAIFFAGYSSLSAALESNSQATTYRAQQPQIDKQEVQPLSDEEIDDALRFLQQSILDIEHKLGPFHDDLAEKLFQIGIIYQIKADYDQALSYLERSLQIKKTNVGLYHESHFSIVESLIQTHRLTGKWKVVDEYYEYLNWLYLRVYGEASTKRLSVLNKLIMWKVEAVNARVTDNSDNLLSEALSAARQAGLILNQHPHINPNEVLAFSEQELKRALRGRPRRQSDSF